MFLYLYSVYVLNHLFIIYGLLLIYLSIYSLCTVIFHSLIYFFLNSFCIIDWLIQFSHLYIYGVFLFQYLDPPVYCFVFFIVAYLLLISLSTYLVRNCQCIDWSFFMYGIHFVNPFRFNRYNILMDYLSFWISLAPH